MHIAPHACLEWPQNASRDPNTASARAPRLSQGRIASSLFETMPLASRSPHAWGTHGASYWQHWVGSLEIRSLRCIFYIRTASGVYGEKLYVMVGLNLRVAIVKLVTFISSFFSVIRIMGLLSKYYLLIYSFAKCLALGHSTPSS